MSTTAVPSEATGFEIPRLNLMRAAPSSSRAMIALESSLELDTGLKHLVKLRASIVNGCAYCVDMHSKEAREAGESERRLLAVAAWHEAPFFSDRERAAFALADAVTLVAADHVPQTVYDQAARFFQPPELAQLIWTIVAINGWNRVAIASRMLPEDYEQPEG